MILSLLIGSPVCDWTFQWPDEYQYFSECFVLVVTQAVVVFYKSKHQPYCLPPSTVDLVHFRLADSRSTHVQICGSVGVLVGR